MPESAYEPWQHLTYEDETHQVSTDSSRSLSDWSEELAAVFDEAARRFSNEMELREHVHSKIVAAVADLYGLGLSATAGEINTKKGGGRSPLDRLYGGVAVEWEWDMSSARREHGAGQALTYLRNLRANNPSEGAFTAVVADGKTWGFLRVDPDDEMTADLFTDQAEPATAADHFVWFDNSPAACRQFLELIGSHKKSPITGNNLRQRFGPESDVASKIVTLLGQAIDGRAVKDRTDTFYREWRRALEVVYGDLDLSDSDLAIEVQTAYRAPVSRPLGEMLFVLHTYFALVGRLIAVELLAVAVGEPDDAPTGWRGLDAPKLLERLDGLEHGSLPADLEISNLFEEDLFSWWTEHAEGNTDLLGAIRDLLKEVSELAFPQIVFGPQNVGDVLRDLYQALIPKKLRKALGEFLTPHWLAQACIARCREQGANVRSGRILDPTCGTGTFITPLLQERLRQLAISKKGTETPDDVQAVLDSVTGIDLNPVAVTAARVNFVLALGEYAKYGPLTLPIWRSDSLVVPEPSLGQQKVGPIGGIPHSTLSTSLDEPFVVPIGMTSTAHLSALRSILEKNIYAVDAIGMTDEAADRARAAFREDFAETFGAAGRYPLKSGTFKDEQAVADYLFEQVLSLARAGRDGVWARLIENAYAPLFAGRFDVVIGNPPWLTWTKLPEAWRAQSEPLWKRAGLWYTPAEPGESFNLQTSDIATLVYAVSLIRYAKDGGYVGLLTPKALIDADPGSRAFRQFRLRPDPRDKADVPETDVQFGAVWVDDWSKIQPFNPDAANRPIFLLTQRGRSQDLETPGVLWEREPNVQLDKSSWRAARPTLRENQGNFAPVDPQVLTSAWRFQHASRPDLIQGGTNNYTFGKGLDTRGANGIFLVDVKSPKPAQGQKKATIKITNRPSEGRNKEVQQTSGTVETELIYPVLRGRDVSHWVAKPSLYMIFPHDPDDVDRAMPADRFKKEYPKGLAWLSRHRGLLENRRTPPSRNWDMSRSGDDWVRLDGPLKHMSGDHLVVVRELSNRPAAALVEAGMDLNLGGRKVAPLVDHKLMFYSASCRAEALYLVAMINSTPMQDLMESFVNSTSVSPTSLSRLPIPDFDADDPAIRQLLRIANDIARSEDPAARHAALREELDAAVLSVLKSTSAYQPQPRRARRSVRNTALEPSANPTLF